jgi:hypothetical protein
MSMDAIWHAGMPVVEFARHVPNTIRGPSARESMRARAGARFCAEEPSTTSELCD